MQLGQGKPSVVATERVGQAVVVTEPSRLDGALDGLAPDHALTPRSMWVSFSLKCDGFSDRGLPALQRL